MPGHNEFFNKKEIVKEADQMLSDAVNREMPSARRQLMEAMPEWSEERIEEFLKDFRVRAKLLAIEMFKENIKKIRQEDAKSNISPQKS